MSEKEVELLKKMNILLIECLRKSREMEALLIEEISIGCYVELWDEYQKAKAQIAELKGEL